MKAKELLKEINKSKRFLPAKLDEVEVLISKNNNNIRFLFINEEKILYSFKLNEGDNI